MDGGKTFRFSPFWSKWVLLWGIKSIFCNFVAETLLSPLMDCYSKEEIEALKLALEDSMNIKMLTPKHFEQLRYFVFERTGEFLSSTTLKRIWGYLNEPLKTRVTTLSILSQALGYRDWEDFTRRNDGAPSEQGLPSSYKLVKSLNVQTDLARGQLVTLYWMPNRICTIKYLGGLGFVVTESLHTRLQPGDHFECNLILAGHPLYLSNLIRGNSEPTVYICGKLHGGIQFKIHPFVENEEEKELPIEEN